MQAVSIRIIYPPKFVQSAEERDAIRIGQILNGYVQLDGPGQPKKIEIFWRDARNRLLGCTQGEFQKYNRRVAFSFKITQSQFWLHNITCAIDGKLQLAQAQFIVSPATQGWETMPAVTWATYPEGDFNDQLQEVGVNGEIAFKMNHFEHVAASGMRFYIDNCSPDEISCYHRPHKLFWEPPQEAKPPYFPWGRGFRDNWAAIVARYLKMRDRAQKEGGMVSRDQHYRKLLWRDFCPNNPATILEAAKRLSGVVRLHKGCRPLFYNIADEAGIADQTKPFDYCYCPWCMEKFRLQLEQKYQTLTRLNEEWGTDFTNWDDVYPLTADETMAAQKRGQPLNFASWDDHRAFMDDTFADFFRKVRDDGKKWDAIGDFSQGGCQAPSAYGGWDYAKIMRDIDALIPYNIGGNQEVVRSFGYGVRNLSPFFGDDQRLVRGLWYAYIHGDAGVVFWDADEERGRFVTRPDGKKSNRGKVLGPALREIRSGIAQQFKAWTRSDEPIGMLYSQPSVRVHWMLEAMTLYGKDEWIKRDSYESRYADVRMAWQDLIEDRQVQYSYFSYLTVDEGSEDLSRYRLIVLPETLAISSRLATKLRDFVEHGGVLVADGRCGNMAGNGRQVAGGMLDDLFGVSQGSAITLKSGNALRSNGTDSWLAIGDDIKALNVLDRNLKLDPAAQVEVAAKAGSTPALIRRRVGRGWAVYLNVEMAGYCANRMDVGGAAARASRKIMDAVLGMAGIKASVAIRDCDGADTAGIEVTKFVQGSAELYATLTNRRIRISGVGERSDPAILNAFECDRNLELQFNAAAHTWNARTGAYLGNVASIKQKLPQLSPLIVSRLPYRVTDLEVAGDLNVAQGVQVSLELKLQLAEPAQPVEHVLQVEVYQPDGKWCYWYSGTVVTRNGLATFALALALDDIPGNWSIKVRDAVTGTTKTCTLRVKRAAK